MIRLGGGAVKAIDEEEFSSSYVKKRVNLLGTVKPEGGNGKARGSGSPERFVDTRPALPNSCIYAS